MRRPSIRVSVEFTDRPRNETPDEPAPKPPVNEVGTEPLLSAEIERTASDTLLMPALASESEVSTVTGDGVSVSVRRNSVPVTTMSCGWSASAVAGAAAGAAGATVGWTGASCANAGAAPISPARTSVESAELRNSVGRKAILVMVKRSLTRPLPPPFGDDSERVRGRAIREECGSAGGVQACLRTVKNPGIPPNLRGRPVTGKTLFLTYFSC